MSTDHFETIGYPWWDDRPVYIIAGGPSLSGYDLSDLRARGRVIGVNRAADIIPCDATFSIDRMFLTKRREDLATWAIQGQEVIAAVPHDWFAENSPIQGVHYVRKETGKGVGQDPEVIIHGCNSGYGALCLAILKRAREIIMLGYDLHGRTDGQHWHDGYPWGNGSCRIYYERWAERFQDIADELPKGVRVWNANPDSRVQAFQFCSYEDIGLTRVEEEVAA